MLWLPATLLLLWLLIHTIRSFLADVREEGAEQALTEAENNAREKALNACGIDALPVPADKSAVLDGLRRNED